MDQRPFHEVEKRIALQEIPRLLDDAQKLFKEIYLKPSAAIANAKHEVLLAYRSRHAASAQTPPEDK